MLASNSLRCNSFKALRHEFTRFAQRTVIRYRGVVWPPESICLLSLVQQQAALANNFRRLSVWA